MWAAPEDDAAACIYEAPGRDPQTQARSGLCGVGQVCHAALPPVTPHARDGVGDEEEGHCPGALPTRPPGTWDRRLGHGGLELVLGGRGLP